MPIAKAKFVSVAAAALLAGLVAGCANNSSSGPTAQALPPGSTCGSIRAELSRLDARGVQSKVEALNAGRRMSEPDRAVAQRYNDLLNQYLGARCHA
ncbi:MAG: hypothetical protein NW205_09090 [Hyphomicrobiaceae bacterium]|nr:hypothetical protein [Hyphomicrobiaceae bacterium]